MRRIHVPELLRDGNFTRYLIGSSVSTLGSGMSTVALAFAVLDMGGVTDLGIVLLAREVPTIIFVLLGGVFADRIRRRTILVSTDLLKALTQGLTALLFFSGSADLLTVVALQVIFGTAGAFSGPATTGLVREVAADETLQEANALLQLSRSILNIAGPAVGALIVAAGSPALALAIDAASFLVSAAFTFSMRLPGVVRVAAASILVDLRGGWREFVERRGPWRWSSPSAFFSSHTSPLSTSSARPSRRRSWAGPRRGGSSSRSNPWARWSAAWSLCASEWLDRWSRASCSSFLQACCSSAWPSHCPLPCSWS
ncbi:MAG TPA: MFS transporter [Candidatus Limnocylindrales bacterium]